MSLLKKSAYSVFWEFSSKFSRQGAQFLISIILTRLLTPEEFGLIGIVMVFIVFFNFIIDSGLSQIVTQKTDATQEDYDILYSINFISGLLLFFLLNVCARPIAVWYKMPELQHILHALSLLLPLYSMTIVYDTWLKKHLRFRTVGLALFLSTFVSGVLGVLFAFFGFGVWSLVVQALSGALVLVYIKATRCELKVHLTFSPTKMRAFIKKGRGFFFTSLFYKVNDRIDIFFIGRFISAEFLGYFTRAKTFKNLIILNSSSTVNSVLFPLLSRVKENRHDFIQYVNLSNNFVNFMAASATGLLLISSDYFFLILFGEKWIPSVPIFNFLCIGGYFMSLTGIQYNILRSLGKGSLLAKIGLFETLLNVIIFLAWLLFKMPFNMLLILVVTNSAIVFLIHVVATRLVVRWSFYEQLNPFLRNSIFYLSAYFFSGYLANAFHLADYVGVFFFAGFILFDLCVIRFSRIKSMYLRVKGGNLSVVN